MLTDIVKDKDDVDFRYKIGVGFDDRKHWILL